MPNQERQPKTGWSSTITKLSLSALVFLTVTGLLIAYAPFHAAMEWGVLIHTLIGLLILLPIVWYSWIHWADYRQYNLSDALLLGYVAVLALLLCLVSGLVVTWQGLFGIRMSPTWRGIHLYSTWATLITGLPHILLVWIRTRQKEPRPTPGPALWRSLAVTIVGLAVIALLGVVYPGQEYVNELPEDYSYLYGEDRPFAPSLAMTVTGGGLDPESLAGSNSCGTSNCHSQILEEWKPSAHRYSAMDPLFQKVQSVMAEQNGPESTRYCGGCHDPISSPRT
jgi:hypothetical protein